MKRATYIFIPTVLIVAVALTACTGTSGGSAQSASTVDSAQSTLTANMQNAVKVGKVQSGYSSVGAEAVSAGDYVAADDLVTIDSSGNVHRVFSTSIAIHHIATTTNYVIVSGDFSKRHGSVVRGHDDQPIDCKLIAIPKTAHGHSRDIICLANGANIPQVGSYSVTEAASNPHYAHYGFATRGSDVYFTDFTHGILYKWSEGDATPSTVFEKTYLAGTGMDDVFLDASSNHVCVLYSAVNTFTGHIFCGDDNALTEVAMDAAVLAETRRLGQWLVSTDQKIDMTNVAAGAVSRTASGTNGGLPIGVANIVSDGSGGIVGRGYDFTIVHMDSMGNTTVIADNGTGQNFDGHYFQQVFHVGSYIWTWSVPIGTIGSGLWDYAAAFFDLASQSQPISNHTLNRLAVSATPSMDTTGDGSNGGNYLGNVGLDYITNMSMSGDGMLRVSGMKNGARASALIDSAGNITLNAPVSVPFDHLISL